MHEILNAIFYVVSGCAWQLLPTSPALADRLPLLSTLLSGWNLGAFFTWSSASDSARVWAQPAADRIIDGQSVRTTGVSGVRGYDCAKRVNGRKRHILVDIQDIQDRAAVPLLLEGIADSFPLIEHLWVDQDYTGSGKSWIEEHLSFSLPR